MFDRFIKCLFSLITVLFATFSVNAQIEFQKTFGDIDYDDGSSVGQTSDGGYVIVGSTVNFGAGGNYGVYLLRLNMYGDTLFTRVYYGNPQSIGLNGRSVQETSDGGFIITGAVSTGSPNANILLLRTDPNGVVLWERGFGGTSNDFGYSAQQTSDGGFVVGGMANLGSDNACIIKVDSTGNPSWARNYGGGSLEGCNSIQQTVDGGYIITGYTRSYVSGIQDLYLIKTNSIGDTVWSRAYGGLSGYEEGQDVRETFDGGYIIVGYTTSFGAGGADVYVIKTQANGDTIWTRTFGSSMADYGTSIRQTSDSGYVLCGYTSGFGAGGEDVYFIKLNSSGNMLWSKTFGGAYYDEGQSVVQANDNGYLIAGYSSSFGSGSMDLYLIKTDTNGISGCNDSIPNTIQGSTATLVTRPHTSIYSSMPQIFFANSISSGGNITTQCFTVSVNEIIPARSCRVFPDPFVNETSVRTEADLIDATFIIYDSFGRTMKKITQIYGNSFSISCSELPSGVYVFEIVQKNEVYQRGKFVLSR